MQKVSRSYKRSMKEALRERGYIMISFGLINQEAQANAKVTKGNYAYYSNKDNVLGEHDDRMVYATLEENFTRVDGSMLFLPRPNESGVYYDTGIVSKNLVSEEQFELTIELNIKPTDIKGLTLNFGENYPVDFDVVGSTGQVIQFRNNEMALFRTEEVLTDTTQVKLIVYRMKHPQNRVRIYQIRFGYGLVYTNEHVMSSTLDSYVSLVGEDVPQIDFSVTLKNYDQYFNVDNPKSAINFLETGQEMEIYYGYETPGTDQIEWILGNHLLCSEWESDDFTATIRCQDVFRNLDTEYYKGKYNPKGISYYDLADTVLKENGVEGYYIDPHLKKLFTKNPLPRVPCREALQIISNACRSVLSQTRQGSVQIKSNFIPEKEASTPTEAPYSNIKKILDGKPKEEYASLNTNYTVVDGSMFFYPRDGVGAINTGYVSAELSNAQGLFETRNPTVIIQQEAACMWYGAVFEFGNCIPSAFTIRTYKYGEPVVTRDVTADEIEKKTVLYDPFDDFDCMEIEFTQTAEPFNRIVLNNFRFGDVTDFEMTRNDMMTSPKAIKQELIKEVVVPAYSYQNGEKEESLISEEVTVVANEERLFFIGEASYNYRVEAETTNAPVIVESGDFYVKLRFKDAGKYRVEVHGWRYKIVEQYAIKTLNPRGKTIKWENPLMSDIELAKDLAQWLGDYYTAGIEYEYDTRGNPELDVNDTIYQQNDFAQEMKVTVYRQTLEFSQGFRGKVTARRIGGGVNAMGKS